MFKVKADGVVLGKSYATRCEAQASIIAERQSINKQFAAQSAALSDECLEEQAYMDRLIIVADETEE